MDIPPLAPLITHVEPSLLWTHMGMHHLQPGDLAHPASCPVAQSEEGGSTSISRLFDQRVQDGTLLWREQSLSPEQPRGGKLNATSWVALEHLLLLNQKIGKIADG